MSLQATPAGRDARSVTATVWAAAPLIVWSAHFLIVYCGAAVLCATGLADATWLGWHPTLLVAGLATAAALGCLALVALAPAGRPVRDGTLREPDRFLGWQSRAMAALAALGVLLVAYPVLALGGSCA